MAAVTDIHPGGPATGKRIVVGADRAGEIAERIGPYKRRYRKRLRRLAHRSDAFADLLTSFPAAAFMIAVGFRNQLEQRECLAGVEAGRPLKGLAETLGIPSWYRKLRPGTLAEPLPLLPADHHFARRVAGGLPADPAAAYIWLTTIAEAERIAGADFAAWVAHRKALFVIDTHDRFPPIATLALYAWFSRRPDTGAGRLIARRWRATMTYEKALDAVENWIEKIKLELYLTGDGLADTWMQPGRVNGYEIAPIFDKAGLTTEAQAMDNCLLSYVDAMAEGVCRLFSICRDGERLATLEIRAANWQAPVAGVNDLLGPGNEPVDEDIWRAVYAWLAGQPTLKLPAHPDEEHDRLPVPRLAAWRNVWGAYFRDGAPTDMLPERPGAGTMSKLNASIWNLRGRG